MLLKVLAPRQHEGTKENTCIKKKKKKQSPSMKHTYLSDTGRLLVCCLLLILYDALPSGLF